MKNDVIPATLYRGIIAIHDSCSALAALTAFYVQKEKERVSGRGCSEISQNLLDSQSTREIHMPHNTTAWFGVGCLYIL